MLQRREGREGGSEGDGAGVADLIFSAMRWGGKGRYVRSGGRGEAIFIREVRSVGGVGGWL